MNTISKTFSYISKQQLALQSIILWIVALTNLGTNYFWPFAISAITISGLSDILNQLRILNKNQDESEN